MARITSEKAIKMIGNQFDLVLVASQRAREIKRGSLSKVGDSNGPIISALKEIEEGHYTKDDYLKTIKGKR
jgi:DNA-directed RNA polymerase omega subunit